MSFSRNFFNLQERHRNHQKKPRGSAHQIMLIEGFGAQEIDRNGKVNQFLVPPILRCLTSNVESIVLQKAGKKCLEKTPT